MKKVVKVLISTMKLIAKVVSTAAQKVTKITESFPLESDLNLSHKKVPITSLCIPLPSLAMFMGIKCLQLQGNALTHLSKDIFTLKGLEELNLSFNLLSVLPIEIGRLTALKDLHINKNRIKYLPQTLGDCRELTILDVSGNRLKYLPVELLLCQKLRSIWLDENVFFAPGNSAANSPFGIDPSSSSSSYSISFPPLPSLTEISAHLLARIMANHRVKKMDASAIAQESDGIMDGSNSQLHRKDPLTGSAFGRINDQSFTDDTNASVASAKSKFLSSMKLIDRMVLNEQSIVDDFLHFEGKTLPIRAINLIKSASGVCSHCGQSIFRKGGLERNSRNHEDDDDDDGDEDDLLIGVPYFTHVFKSERFFPVKYTLCSFTCYYNVISMFKGNKADDGDATEHRPDSLRSSRSRTF